MPFSDIVGHERPLAILRWALEKGRLPHAYLFLGPEGVGKKTIGLSLAKAIHCQQSRADFCGQCTSCVRIASGNHPDVRAVEPAAGKKEISIQQIRELEKELSFRTFSGGKKITLVDPAPLMNASAQNALLKTLEEPPKDSVLILISTSTGGLLPTVLSRCVRLSFTPLPTELVGQFLVSQKGVESVQAMFLAALAMGSLGRALSAEMEALIARRRAWLEQIDSLTSEDFRRALAVAEELARTREDSLGFLEWAEGWYRDLLVFSLRGDTGQLCNRDLEEELKRHASRYGLERILTLRSRAAKTAVRIQRNVNRRMALENFFVEAVRLG